MTPETEQRLLRIYQRLSQEKPVSNWPAYLPSSSILARRETLEKIFFWSNSASSIRYLLGNLGSLLFFKSSKCMAPLPNFLTKLARPSYRLIFQVDDDEGPPSSHSTLRRDGDGGTLTPPTVPQSPSTPDLLYHHRHSSSHHPLPTLPPSNLDQCQDRRRLSGLPDQVWPITRF